MPLAPSQSCEPDTHALNYCGSSREVRTDDLDLYLRLNILHRVVYRETGGDEATRAVDIHVHRLVWVFSLEEQELCSDHTRKVFRHRTMAANDPFA